MDAATLEFVLEELKESRYGDAGTSQKLMEELTLTCKFKEDDLKKFTKEVSKNCPIDATRLQKEVSEAKGRKEEAFKAINKAAGRAIS